MKQKKEEPPLPPRATGIFLGLWMAIFIILALFVVPQVFSICAASSP